MATQRETLSAFLTPALAAHGLTLDDATLDLIDRHVKLTERPGDESRETRTIRLHEDSMGKISAESIKLWNIAQVSTYDIFRFLGKETGILLFDDTAKKAIYSLVMLLFEFYPRLKISFNEQDARVIYAIARLDEREFTAEAVKAQYDQLFDKSISTERLAASLTALTDYRVLKRTGGDTYRLREKIKNLSRTSEA